MNPLHRRASQMNTPEPSRPPDLTVAASRHPDAATLRRGGQGDSPPDLAGAVERASVGFQELPRQAQQVELIALHLVSKQGYSVRKITHQRPGPLVSRYIKIQAPNGTRACIRISDHRKRDPGRRLFSITWSRPKRVWELSSWLHHLKQPNKENLDHGTS